MRRYHSWLAALGIAAATPGLAIAGPLSMFTGDRDSRPAQTDAKEANTKMANEVAKALRGARLVGYKIEVECRNGEVTLIGEVPTAQQRALATKAAESVPGVRAVQNQLAVKEQTAKAPARPAPEMTASRAPAKRQPIQQVQFEDGAGADDVELNQAKANQIASALRAARFGGDNVEIQYQDGVAMISGSVPSAEARQRATSIISRIPGVKKVDNQLAVDEAMAAAAPARQPATGNRGSRQPIRQVQYDESMAMAQAQQAGPGGPPVGSMGVPPIGPGGNGYPAYPASAMGGGPGPSPINGMPMNAANPVMYDQPNLPEHAWPAYAAYPNYAAVTYPKQYSASAWPYIGPFYPYPQVPLGWRKVQLEWDDGYWQLNFRPRTDRWWWFMNPQNW